ncbi:MAG: YncE family protein [Bacteroidota bacterium]
MSLSVIQRLFFPLFVSAVLFTPGCDLLGTDDEAPFSQGVYIGNQGDFGTGNGSVSFYDPASNTATTVISDLESIVQSIELHGGRLYVAANTAGRVDVFDAASRDRIGTVEGLVSPRYMAFSNDRLFITNLYDASGTFSGGTVTVAGLDDLSLEREITVGNNPEGIAAAGSRIYVANQGFGEGQTLSVIDAETLEVVQTVDVACDGPRTVIADNEDDVFVFCTGRILYDDDWNVVGATDGAIVILEGSTGTVTDRIDVGGRMMAAAFGQDAFFDAENDRIYALRQSETAGSDRFDVLVLDTGSNEIIEIVGPFEAPIGAVAFDAIEGALYLSAVEGFTAAGSVRVYSPAGTLIRSFSAGVAPTSIRFYRPE